MKLTPWFPLKVSPNRVGWYACNQCKNKNHFWDGVKWSDPDWQIEQFYTDFKWRGLARKPK